MGPNLQHLSADARAALTQIALGEKGRTPLLHVMRQNGMEHLYPSYYAMIIGNNTISPFVMLHICKMYGDFTPLYLQAEALGIHITAHTDGHEPNPLGVLGDLLKDNAAMGELNAEFEAALQDGKITASEKRRLVGKAQRAIQNISATIEALGKVK